MEHCNTRKQFGLHLSKYSLVKNQIAKMAEKLYCLESMVYLTAGLADIRCVHASDRSVFS